MTKQPNGSVLAIYVGEDAGKVMTSVNSSRVIAGRGLEGDRYALGRGAFSDAKPYKIRHLSLISKQAIETANQQLEVPYDWSETRRNVVVDAVELNDLVGERFTIGNVSLLGTELCNPCKRPDNLTGKVGFKNAFHNLGGLRVEVLTSGLMAVGSEVHTR